MTGIAGKVAIVTGGARGIGLGIARGLAREGAIVVVLDIDGAEAEAVAGELDRGPGVARAITADVSNEAEVAGAVEQVVSAYGRIDVLVNNAGVARQTPTAEMSLREWLEVISINLTGVFLCSRAVLPTMVAQASGCIVNIGSQLGFTGAAGMAHYTAAKAGIHGFTKALAREVAGLGVRVNAVAPGPVETANLASFSPAFRETLRNEIPLHRFAEVDDIVPTVLLLASDGGSYYAGSVLNVSGGHVM